MPTEPTGTPGAGTLWYRVEPRLDRGHQVEVFGGGGRPVADDRVVDFSRPAGDLLIPAYLTPYPPMADPDLLGDFIQTFSLPHTPTDEEVMGFYRCYGSLGDRGWMDRLLEADRRELPDASRLGQREPLWYTREAATELGFFAALYWGVCENDLDAIREAIGKVPATGQLAQILVLAGELKKVWASPEDLLRRVGSIGDWEPSARDPGRDLTPEECLGYARGLLAGRLNEFERRAHRQWTHPRELPQDTGSSREAGPARTRPNLLAGVRMVAFDSLLVAAYLQLSDGAEESRMLHRCHGCQRFFWARRPNQEYCTARCAGAYRRRQFARRHGEPMQDEETDRGRG